MGIFNPILVTGCFCSGTALVGATFENCGAFGGKMSDRFNNIEILKDVVKPCLRKLGADPRGQKPLPDMIKVYDPAIKQIERMREQIIAIIIRQGFDLEAQWFYADPRLTLIWPLWYLAFPRARWVIVRRSSNDIVHSCLKSDRMQAYHGMVGWMSWVDFYIQRIIEILFNGGNVMMLWPQMMIDGDYREINRIVERLNLDSSRISKGVAWPE